MIKSEKFKQWIEIIADEYCIGFGKYLDSLTAKDMRTLSVNELLEIYKETL